MMTMPLFVYPTVVLLDDRDALFLQNIALAFTQQFQIKTYHSPLTALSYLEHYSPQLNSSVFLNGCNHHEEYDLNNHLPVDIDLTAIAELHNNKKRLDDITVMIVDYDMPDMTGIELCHKLQYLPIKKILLTHQTNLAEAVAAFNEGIIHCHIRKDAPQLTNNVLLYVDHLTRQYFNEISKPLLAHLQADYLLPQSDPTFITFFNQWCNENHIKEYYLIDKNGSLLVINNNNEHYYFVVHTDRTLNAFTELYHDAIEVSHFVSLVKQRHKIYFFGAGKDAWDFNSEEWGRYFHSPHLLHGRERYYWVVNPSNPVPP